MSLAIHHPQDVSQPHNLQCCWEDFFICYNGINMANYRQSKPVFHKSTEITFIIDFPPEILGSQKPWTSDCLELFNHFKREHSYSMKVNFMSKKYKKIHVPCASARTFKESEHSYSNKVNFIFKESEHSCPKNTNQR